MQKVSVSVWVVVLSMLIGALVKLGLYGEAAFLACCITFHIWMPEEEEVLEDEPK